METLRSQTKRRLYTKMLRIHLFSIFTIKMPRALAALAPLGLLIVKTLTNVLYYSLLFICLNYYYYIFILFLYYYYYLK